MEHGQGLDNQQVSNEERLTGELHAVMGYLDQARRAMNQIMDELEGIKDKLPDQDRTAIASTLDRIDKYAEDFHGIAHSARDRLGLSQQS
jgi:DNA gyrase/topoisomerase IV subunit A